MAEAYDFNRERLIAAIRNLPGHKVLVVGDIMLDEYLEGDAERISPEAPIPIVKVARSRFLLGGAGNVCRNIASLGGRVTLVSVRGMDAKGETLEAKLAEGSVSATLLSVASRPTTLKTRVIARNQQMLRIDHEEASALPAGETAALLDSIAAIADDYGVIVVSDYGKGVVTRDLMHGLAEIRAKAKSKPKLLVDPKTPNFDLYARAFILTPNAKETSEAAGLPTGTREEILAAGRTIFSKLHCDHLLTTLGAKGMALFLTGDEVWHIPTAAQKVFDVTGAGDTVMAVLALCQASGLRLLESCVLANYAAGIVVAEVGAGCVTADTLEHVVENAEDPKISRWK